MKFSFFQAAKDQFTPVPPVLRADLTGQTILVVGANIGLGFEAAKHFASMNPGKLILACRSQAKGDAALVEIQKATGCKTAEMWLLDLSNLASVKAFAERFSRESERLDIAVMNAAIAPPLEPTLTNDGWETAFETNYLSQSLLSILLIPKMLETAEQYNTGTLPRLVVVTSGMHHQAKLMAQKEVLEAPSPLRVFGGENSYTDATVRYSDTKLLNVLFTRALSSRLSTKPFIGLTVCPGFCVSNLRSGWTGIGIVINFVLELLFARTTEVGSRQLVWAALAGKKGHEEELRGAYVANTRIEEASDWVLSEEGKRVQDLLWTNLIDELSKIDPKVGAIADRYLNAPQ